MRRPVLVLQYPNPDKGSATIPIAFTSNLKALRYFREIVLEEARLAAMDWTDDDVIKIQNEAELHRLEKLLCRLIPDETEE